MRNDAEEVEEWNWETEREKRVEEREVEEERMPGKGNEGTHEEDGRGGSEE